MILIDDYDTIKTQRGLACNYECVKEGLYTENIREYSGPVRIIIKKNPQDKYNMLVKGAAGLAFVNYFIGAVSWIVLLREAATVGNDKAVRMHVGFCTSGVTLLSGFGMINIFHIFGASHSLKRDDIKQEHYYFHLAGLMCAVIGGLFQIGNADKEGGEKHVSVCIISLLSGIASFATGVVVSQRKKKTGILLIIHLVSGVVTCFWYTLCYATGLESDYFHIFCGKLAVFGCEVLCFLHCIVFIFVFFASMTYILKIVWKGKRDVKICVSEKEFEAQKKKEAAEQAELAEEQRKLEEKQAKADYVEKKLLEAEEAKKKKPLEKVKKSKGKKKKPKAKKVKKVRR